MEQLTVNQKKTYPFPIAAVFLIVYTVSNFLYQSLYPILDLFIYGYWPDEFDEWISFLLRPIMNDSFIHNLIVFFLHTIIIVIAIMLFTKKPNVAFPILFGVIFLFFSLSGIDRLYSFLTGFRYIYDIIDIIECFDYILEEFFENFFEYLIGYSGYVNSIFLYGLAFAILIPISVNACLKKRKRVLSVIWFVPGIIACFAHLPYSICTIVDIIFYGDLFFLSLIETTILIAIDVTLVISIFALGLWFSRVSSIRANAALAEKQALMNTYSSDIATPEASYFADNVNVQANQSYINSYNRQNTANMGVADELRKYKNLLDEGVISQEEFNKIKSQFLKNI